jgi:excisionase family DNA binding protein
MTRTWTPDTEPDEVWTGNDVAGFLKIHLKTVYKLATLGQIPGQRIGRNWRFSKKEIHELIRGAQGHGETE